MSKIRTLIIDDEQLAREIIKSYLTSAEDIEIVGECSDGFEGFKQIYELKPDLVFLDVMMPKLTGFEMLELLDDLPVIIFSTAYDEYAIKAFEKNAVDYLLKPYAQQRFTEALDKARQKVSAVSPNDGLKAVLQDHQESEQLTRIAVKTGAKINIIGIDKLRYLEAMDDYVKLHTQDGVFLKQNTMKYFEARLPERDFARIHRSFILRVKELSKLELMGKDSHVAILHDGTELAVSRSGYSRLKELLGF